MKKYLSFSFVFIILSIVLAACQSNKGKDIDSATTIPTTIAQSEQYEIQTITEVSPDKKKTVAYPQLVSQKKDYTTINSLIYNDVTNWISDVLAADASMDLECSVTFNDTAYICVLFEGSITSQNAASPTYVVHALCVSLLNETSIDALELVEINDDFVKQFERQLISSYDLNHFTEDQWADIVSYLKDFSNEELKKQICEGEIILAEDGVLVCINVPHAIGDYIKIWLER